MPIVDPIEQSRAVAVKRRQVEPGLRGKDRLVVLLNQLPASPLLPALDRIARPPYCDELVEQRLPCEHLLVARAPNEIHDLPARCEYQNLEPRKELELK